MLDPNDLATDLERTAKELRRLGESTWQRFDDWHQPRRIARDESRGGGVGTGASDRSLEDRRLDHEASAYKGELRTLTSRVNADLHRLRRLLTIANPDTPEAKWECCRSCERDGGRQEPVGTGRYRNACRFCGDWRGEHGDWPPLAVVRWRAAHPGKPVPLHVVEQSA